MDKLKQENDELRAKVDCLESIIRGSVPTTGLGLNYNPEISSIAMKQIADIKVQAVIEAIAETRSEMVHGSAKWLCRVVDLEEYANKLKQV